jgi:hypothetical protein
MNRILTLSVTATGLRVGIWRPFAPFSRPFLIPWNDLVVVRTTLLGWWPVAELQFGQPVVGRLAISVALTDQLALAAQGHWPETSLPPTEPNAALVRRLVIEWIALTSLAAAFFSLAPRLMTPNASGVPIGVAILLPAVVCGAGMLSRYFRARAR